MKYTIGEMAKKLGVSASALRYYDSVGLLPFVERSRGGSRLFKDEDLEWLRVIECLKRTGMRLDDIRRFVDMAIQGDATIGARRAMITKQREAVTAKLAELEETLAILKFKEWYYATAEEHGTTAVPRGMPPEEIPAELREARRLLLGDRA